MRIFILCNVFEFIFNEITEKLDIITPLSKIGVYNRGNELQ